MQHTALRDRDPDRHSEEGEADGQLFAPAGTGQGVAHGGVLGTWRLAPGVSVSRMNEGMGGWMDGWMMITKVALSQG